MSPVDRDFLAQALSEDRTDRLAREGAARGVFRQCSIGWHFECSDPDGERCACTCHPERRAAKALPLPTEPGLYVDRFGDPWKLNEHGEWWFGNDNEVDPREGSPLVRLEVQS